MDRHIIERAHEITYGERISYEANQDQYMDSIVDQKEIQTLLEDKRRTEERYKEKEKRERSEALC